MTFIEYVLNISASTDIYLFQIDSYVINNNSDMTVTVGH